ncbi:hypothetical protein MTO96_025576 [Rhipicephalus appendiculatus]
MPAGTENPADYYKNVAFSPTSVNGETKKPAGNASEGMGEFAPEKTGKRAPEGDEACVEAKKPRLQDSSELEDVKVPREVELFRFLGSRADEIASLVKDVERKYPKLISQQVPRHMRRRTPDPPKSKRPSRKHRRRPRNLLAEYARRQRRHVWLETHIWHAKRFKMADLWGYRVPLHPTDKGIRAAYRGSAKHVLLHDLSYYNCIELIGNEGNASLQADTLDKRRCRSHIWSQVLPFWNPRRHGGVVPPVADNKKDPEKDEASMAEVVQLPVYTNGSVTMVQLKEQMVRFSLTGPLATGVVLNARAFPGGFITRDGSVVEQAC